MELSRRPRPAVSKIFNTADLIEVIRSLRQGKRVVFTNGCFDILHAGHTSLLEQARSFGDFLVVGVNSDESVRELKGRARPVQRLQDRMTILASLEAVDFVVDFAEIRPLRLIEQLKPDIHVKGGDYRADELPESALVRSYGGEVRIIPIMQGRSTTGLIQALQDKE